jgi:hypothetical protein
MRKISPKTKTDCHWWLIKKPSHNDGCAVLTCLKCAKGKCRFYETEEQYQARQDKFAREHPDLEEKYTKYY